MAQSPIVKTMDEMLTKLAEATSTYREAEKSIAEYSSVIRALAQVCEDDDLKATYLLKLEELSGKPGFMEAIRSVLRKYAKDKPLTPRGIKTYIVLGRVMELSGYTNPMASIHTTLRRLRESGEIIEVANNEGEKAYRLAVKAPVPPASMRKRLGLDEK